MWTTIGTISGYISKKTTFHREKIFHFSRFFICFSCTPIDKISVIMFCENELSSKIVFVCFSGSSRSFLCTPFEAIVWNTLCENIFSWKFFSSCNFFNNFLLLPQWHDLLDGFMWKPSFMEYNFFLIFKFCFFFVILLFYPIDTIFRIFLGESDLS